MMVLEKALTTFINRLEQEKIPIHSLLISQDKQIFLEGYYHPIHAQSLQRMFSITKSMTGVAILLLATEGKLKLDDPIVNYFDEYIPSDPHPWLTSMTISDLLTMRTCHKATTYKIDSTINWVRSFFITEPTQPPGRFFNYDTSASHTLAALTEKLAGMKMLDYLRQSGLKTYGLTDDAYILTDPFDISMGGSGLMATSRDLLAFGQFLCEAKGEFQDYLNDATQIQTSITMSGFHHLNITGYGYQFWTLPSGYMAYGMGGQHLLIFPQHAIVTVITADTQNYPGADERILNLFTSVLPILKDHSCSTLVDFTPHFQDKIAKLTLSHLPNHGTLPLNWENGIIYHVTNKTQEFQKLSLNMNDHQGELHLIQKDTTHIIHFGRGYLQKGISPLYQHTIYSSGAWCEDGTFLITCHIIDESKGKLYFQLSFSEDELLLLSRKVEETLYIEFDQLRLVGKKYN